MNEFLLYHNLCNLYTQTEPYAGAHALFGELKNSVEQFSSKTYRVAVIGEFKRGKSSLVNALLGMEILPTDILPTTAVINRVIYSLDQKIVIYFKNGETKESTIDSLADYATKLDKEKEQFAETIQEIVVHYPSVLGQNHIELIDTPGLNDNESITETTLSVLGNIDTAIVVISATIPLSMTEQNLICDLIKQTDVYNLTFAVTFIDRVSDEEDEQDRVVELIKSRLSEDTLRHFIESVGDKQLVEKAERILSQPNIYAVSSKQAIQGFIKGRNDLIEKSRFTHFKYNLSALLTANQEKDRLLKINRICSDIKGQISEWIEQHLQSVEESIQRIQARCAALRTLCHSSQAHLNAELLQLEDHAQKKKNEVILELTNGAEISRYLIRFFITRLSSIKRSDFCEAALRAALQQACTEANRFMETVAEKLTITLDALAKDAFGKIELYYEDALCELDEKPTAVFLKGTENNIQVFKLSEDDIFQRMSNLFDECIPHISAAVLVALEEFHNHLEDYLAAYRLLMIRYQKEIKIILENAVNKLDIEIDNKKRKLQNERCVAENEQAQIVNTILKIDSIIN